MQEKIIQVLKKNIHNGRLDIPLVIDKTVQMPELIKKQEHVKDMLKYFAEAILHMQGIKINYSSYSTDMRSSNMKGIIRNIHYSNSHSWAIIYSPREAWRKEITKALEKYNVEYVFTLDELRKALSANASLQKTSTEIREIEASVISLDKLFVLSVELENSAKLILADLKKKHNSLNENERDLNNKLIVFSQELESFNSNANGSLSTQQIIQLKKSIIDYIDSFRELIVKIDSCRMIPAGFVSMVFLSSTLLVGLGVSPNLAFAVSSTALGGKSIKDLICKILK